MVFMTLARHISLMSDAEAQVAAIVARHSRCAFLVCLDILECLWVEFSSVALWSIMAVTTHSGPISLKKLARRRSLLHHERYPHKSGTLT